MFTLLWKKWSRMRRQVCALTPQRGGISKERIDDSFSPLMPFLPSDSYPFSFLFSLKISRKKKQNESMDFNLVSSSVHYALFSRVPNRKPEFFIRNISPAEECWSWLSSVSLSDRLRSRILS